MPTSWWLRSTLQADVGEVEADLVAGVGEVVDRRHGEVAALVAGLVAAVAALLGAAGVPGRLDGVDVVVAGVLLGLEAHVVEDVELGLGAEVGGVGDAGRLEVGLGLGRDVARVAAVGLAGERVDDREVHDERLLGPERVEVGARRVGDELHVGLVDRLEAADRRAVEHLAVGEEVDVDRLRGHVEVLHDAGQVAEPDVDELDVLVLDVREDLLGEVELLETLFSRAGHE